MSRGWESLGFAAMQQKMPSSQQMQEFRKNFSEHATTDMVKQTLVDQALKKEEAGVDEADINKHVEGLRGLLKMQKRDLDAVLAQQGHSIEDFKKDIRKQLALTKVMEKQEGLKPPSDSEIHELFEKNQLDLVSSRELPNAYRTLGYALSRRGDATAAMNAMRKGQALFSQLVKANPQHSLISLRANATNPAVRLYERFGFKVVRESEGHVVMAREI